MRAFSTFHELMLTSVIISVIVSINSDKKTYLDSLAGVPSRRWRPTARPCHTSLSLPLTRRSSCSRRCICSAPYRGTVYHWSSPQRDPVVSSGCRCSRSTLPTRLNGQWKKNYYQIKDCHHIKKDYHQINKDYNNNNNSKYTL